MSVWLQTADLPALHPDCPHGRKVLLLCGRFPREGDAMDAMDAERMVPHNGTFFHHLIGETDSEARFHQTFGGLTSNVAQ